jgi:hypothetical protein
MKVVVGNRATGKTTQLIQMMRRDPQLIMICGSAHRVRELEAQYPELGPARFWSMAEVKHGGLRGRQHRPAVVDDVDQLLYELLGIYDPIYAISLTGEVEA